MAEKKNTVKELNIEVEELRKTVKDLQNITNGIKVIQNVDVKELANKVDFIDNTDKYFTKVEILEKKISKMMTIMEKLSEELKEVKDYLNADKGQ